MSENANRSVSDAIHMREAAGPCEIHDWPTDGLARRLIEAMRAKHGKGGVNVCRECILRARYDAREKAVASARARARRCCERDFDGDGNCDRHPGPRGGR